MDSFAVFVALFFIAWTWFNFFRPRKSAKLPPGPKPFPIIGNVLQLGQSPHRSLTKLSKTYGPIMSLQLGNKYTIVVSSPELAREVLKTHDQAFSGRTIFSAACAHDHDKLSMAYLPVGSQWRKLRKICREQMFSNTRLEANQYLRQDRLQKLREYVNQCRISGRAVNINEAAFVTTLNLMSATLFSAEFIKFDSDETREFRDLIEGIANIVGLPNFADYFPILKPFDLQGIQRRADILFGRLLKVIGEIVDERLKRKGTSPKKNDLLETLLDLSQGSEYELTTEDIVHLLLDLFVAGSDTTASTTEWTMTELLRNPEKLAKARHELRTIIGEGNQVDESDMSRLPYFQALIKEVFRYHPPGPLLIPRKAEYDVEVSGYIIPKGTQMFVNVWAMGRDPSVWPNPESFEPERFLDSKLEFKGQDFELIPFGSGKRICPGMPLANRMLHITVATLIHNFDWKLEPGVKPEDVAIDEKFGLSLRKLIPLRAVPV